MIPKSTRSVLLVLLFTLAIPNADAQEVDTLQVLGAKADSLRTVVSETRTHLEAVEDSIRSLERRRQLATAAENEEPLHIGVTKWRASLYEGPDRGSDRIRHIEGDETLGVLGKRERFYRVRYEDQVGYLFETSLDVEIQGADTWTDVWINTDNVSLHESPESESESIRSFNQGRRLTKIGQENGWVNVALSSQIDAKKGWVRASAVSDTQVRTLSTAQRRRAQFIASNPNLPARFEQAIRTGRVVLGMSAPMVRAAIGRPSDINRTTAAWGTRSQWVYGSAPNYRFIYFEDGVVTTIQD